MDEKNDADKLEDVMLPGFRFHPTDEELVGFYLKRKIQQRPLPVELIKQVDIYKYDPWDLPKLAAAGEKECYFYCPRDRKYRNSARPNRVTAAGFWKATGTDRPIYSSDGTKFIGLKKSLVFYRGRAAKGFKTDWMMHEFRLPSVSDSAPSKKLLDKDLPTNDSWAICRIFKKSNSMTQRALSHSWVSPLTETSIACDISTQDAYSAQFSSENTSCTTEIRSAMQLNCNCDLQQASIASFSHLEIPSHKPMNPAVYNPSPFSIPNGDFPNGVVFSPPELSGLTTKCTVDFASMPFNMFPALTVDDGKNSESIDFKGPRQQFNNFSVSSPQNLQGSAGTEEDDVGLRKNQSAIPTNNLWGNVRPIVFPFSLPSNEPDPWKPNHPWDSSPCPSEISTTYSTNKCYTELN